MQKAVFLDRDGTINIEKNYLYRIEDFEYMDGAVEALHILEELGYLLIVITNQSGIARGYYTEEDFWRLSQWMRMDLMRRGIHIAKVYHCPHYPDGIIKKYSVECSCRKPKAKLFWQAQKEFQIDMNQSYAIGDKMRDISICRESNIQGIILTGSVQDFSAGSKGKMPERTIWQYHNLYEAAGRIAKEDNKKKQQGKGTEYAD